MDLSAIQPFLDWVARNPAWMGIVVFLIAMSESLVVVGMIVPGAALLVFGVGPLIALGSLELWPTLAWAVAGAIAGDGLSFWLGHHYREDLRGMWPFRRYPALMARGEEFFHRHGGKSVVFGRFVGPLRALVPAIAGMLGMRPSRFFLANILSAVAWAPVYILPGVAVGASLELASEVTTRLAALVVVLLLVLGITFWLVRRLFNFFQPRANAMAADLLRWGQGRRYVGDVLAAVLEPQHPEARGLTMFAVALAILSFMLVLAGQQFNSVAPWAAADEAVFAALQMLRTPWADRPLVAVSQLGDMAVLAPLCGVVLIYLMVRRQRLAAFHWLAAAAFGVVLMITLGRAPGPALSAAASEWVWQAHLVLSTVLYGFLAVMLSHGVGEERRWIPYAFAVMFVIAIAVARLYLGGLWLSQTLAGLALGFAWVLAAGAAYRRHVARALPSAGFALLVFASVAVAGGWHISERHAEGMARYAPGGMVVTADAQAWWRDEWRNSPAFRIDVRDTGDYPLTLQWAGGLDDIAAHLGRHGWRAPMPLSAANILHWLTPTPDPAMLPLLPQAHDGRAEALVLVHAGARAGEEHVLRLWHSGRWFREENQTLWIGNVSQAVPKTYLRLVTAAVTGTDFITPLESLRPALADLPWRAVQRAGEVEMRAGMRWQGEVWLIRQTGEGK